MNNIDSNPDDYELELPDQAELDRLAGMEEDTNQPGTEYAADRSMSEVGEVAEQEAEEDPEEAGTEALEDLMLEMQEVMEEIEELADEIEH